MKSTNYGFSHYAFFLSSCYFLCGPHIFLSNFCVLLSALESEFYSKYKQMWEISTQQQLSKGTAAQPARCHCVLQVAYVSRNNCGATQSGWSAQTHCWLAGIAIWLNLQPQIISSSFSDFLSVSSSLFFFLLPSHRSYFSSLLFLLISVSFFLTSYSPSADIFVL
jgi:hypothetical protein